MEKRIAVYREGNCIEDCTEEMSVILLWTGLRTVRKGGVWLYLGAYYYITFSSVRLAR
jgi:hypothetical protein